MAWGAAALALSGCGLMESEKPPPCPRVSILAEAAQLTRFRPGPGRDLTDVEHEAEIVGYTGGCSFSDRGGVANINLVVQIVAARGPAGSGPARVPFFIAITDREQRVLAKEVFESVIEIEAGRARAGVTEETTQRLPIPAGRRSSEYEILIGLQLDQDQLEYNRRRRGF